LPIFKTSSLQEKNYAASGYHRGKRTSRGRDRQGGDPRPQKAPTQRHRRKGAQRNRTAWGKNGSNQAKLDFPANDRISSWRPIIKTRQRETRGHQQKKNNNKGGKENARFRCIMGGSGGGNLRTCFHFFYLIGRTERGEARA